jgi:2,3-dihydroxybenzoate decarboxylase
MGEALPFYLWRIDSRFNTSEPKVALREMPSAYICLNIAVTTAGVFAPEPRTACSRTTAASSPGSSRQHH